MKHAVPKRRDPFEMLDEALQTGWNRLDTIPLKGEGEFLVLTVSGLIRMARNGKTQRNRAAPMPTGQNAPRSMPSRPATTWVP